MARSTASQPKSEVRLYVGTEITFGTATLAGETWDEYPVKEWGQLPQFSFAAQQVARRSGSACEPSGGVRHDLCNFEAEIDVTYYATLNVLKRFFGAAFEDAASPYTLSGNQTIPTYMDAVANAYPVTLLFKHAGHSDDLIYTSCVPRRLELMGDVENDTGLLLLKVTYYTAYKPTESDLDPSSQPTWDSSTIRKMCELITGTTQVNAQDLLISNFSIVLEREIGRHVIKDTSSYDPFGYHVGNWSVNGSLHSPKVDANTLNLASDYYDGSAVDISLDMATAASGAIAMPSCVLDNSQITDDDNLRGLDIPFRATFDETDIESTVFQLTISS